MRSKDWRPNPSQETLLLAVLGKGEQVLGAWRKWAAHIDLEKLDPGSFRLIPLLAENLRTLGVSDQRTVLYQGVTRHFWYRSRVLFHRAARVLSDFQRRNIQALALKGGALVGPYYRHGGLRPMGDFDILVPFNQARQAIAALREGGWRPEAGLPEEPDDYCFVVLGRHHFQDAAGFSIDLHWSLFRENTSVHSDDSFWRDALPHTVEGVECRRLQPSDQLLHICKHGVEWDPNPTIRWIVDAARILDSPPICWERFLEQAERLRLGPWLAEALRYLNRRMELPIPEEVLQALEKICRPRALCMEFRAKSRRIEYLGDAPMLWFDYRRLRAHEDFGAAGGSLRRFLRCRWEGDSQVPLLTLIARKLRRRMKSGLSRPDPRITSEKDSEPADV